MPVGPVRWRRRRLARLRRKGGAALVLPSRRGAFVVRRGDALAAVLRNITALWGMVPPWNV